MIARPAGFQQTVQPSRGVAPIGVESFCRSCRASGLRGVLALGRMPLTAAFVTPGQRHGPEPTYPLDLAFCPDCSLLQVLETVPPESIFGSDYPYYSSFSETFVAHARQNALDLIANRQLDGNSLVVELASNDGYLLKHFVERHIPVLGIDPATGPADAAERAGVPTLRAFFGKQLARNLRARGTRADVVIANNVLGHVADTNGFVEGIRTLLKDTGLAVIEVPYVRDLIEGCEFDTIYHEHLCYFSVTALDTLFRRHELFLNAVERLPVHGGSLRLYVSGQPAVQDSVRGLLAEESDLGLDRWQYYERFSRRVRALRRQLHGLLSDLKAAGRTIAAYGAAAKGVILLNFLGLGRDTIDFVVDRNVYKHGKLMPGLGIPVCPPARLLEALPDYALLLSWNFKEEILRQQDEYRRRGGKFIIPLPVTDIV